MPLPPHLPESQLPQALASQLPTAVPAAPWNCRVRALLWLQRAPSPLPSSSPFAGRVRAVAVGGFVDYLDSPVGPYREVLAGQLLRTSVVPVLHVPFIAVDALASVAGGRDLWDLPKTMAEFAVIGNERVVTGDRWSVRAEPRAYGLRFPIRGAVRHDQGSGRATSHLRGTARLARVQVACQGPTLGGWLGAGRHHGVLVEGRLVVGPRAPGPSS